MNRQPWLVVDGYDLITTYKNKWRLLHNNFCGSQNNIVHHFCHGPINEIGPMFTGAIIHLQKLEKLQSFKIYHGTALFEKMPNWHKLDVLFFLSILPPFSSWTSIVSKPLATKNFSFFTCESIGQIEYCLTTTPGLAIVHFYIPKCFIKESNFDTDSFSLPFTL